MMIEGFFVEINLRKKTRLICCSLLSSKSDNIMLIGDFIAETAETIVYDFCEVCFLANLVKKRTCFKNLSKPTSTNLIVRNRPKRFQSTMVIETRLLQDVCYSYENRL